MTAMTTAMTSILNGLTPELGRAAIVLEKDVWVCWVLQQLFQMPGRLPMAFKGGTSLSKVFDAINRFSEDVDRWTIAGSTPTSTLSMPGRPGRRSGNSATH